MAKSGEFYTFDEVVRQLKIDENKLKRLVSEGEISAFREGDIMKFRKEEIDKLSTDEGTESSETVLSEITLEDEGGAFQDSGETLTDDLVFESSETGTGDEVAIESEEAGMATAEISSQDTFIEEEKPDLDDVGMTTEPIDLSADLTEDIDEEEIEAAPVSAAAAARRPVTTRATRAREMAPTGNPGVSFALVLSAIAVLLAFYLSYGTSQNTLNHNPVDPRAPQSAGPGEMANNLSDLLYDSMGKKDVQANIDSIMSEIRSDARDAGTGDEDGCGDGCGCGCGDGCGG